MRVFHLESRHLVEIQTQKQVKFPAQGEEQLKNFLQLYCAFISVKIICILHDQRRYGALQMYQIHHKIKEAIFEVQNVS